MLYVNSAVRFLTVEQELVREKGQSSAGLRTRCTSQQRNKDGEKQSLSHNRKTCNDFSMNGMFMHPKRASRHQKRTLAVYPLLKLSFLPCFHYEYCLAQGIVQALTLLH